MKSITRLMIEEYGIKGRDFMGYEMRKSEASFHHLIVPRRRNGKETKENGAILNGRTSHPYLHVIENIDEDMFLAITSEMIDENIMGRLDEGCIRRIHDILECFEKEYSGLRTSKGKILIKPEYIEGRKLTLRR